MRNFIPFLVLCCVAWWPAAHAEKYEYVSYAVDDTYYSGKDTYTIDTLKEIVFADHGLQPIKLCEDENRLYCFVASSIVFSVPKRELSVGETWESNGQIFTAERLEEMTFIGKNFNVLVISTKRDETRRDYFYYSKKVGLIGIKIVDTNKKLPYIRFLLLKSRKGFPR